MKTKITDLVNEVVIARKAVAVAGCLFACATAQATITLTFDENGNTSASGGTDPYTSLGVVSDNKPQGVIGTQQLPGASGVGGSTLDYGAQLGGVFGGASGAYPQLGWLAIYAYGTPNSDYGTTIGLLDLIHWDNSDTVNNILYQSMYCVASANVRNFCDGSC